MTPWLQVLQRAIKFEEPNVIHFRHAQFHVNPKFNDPALFGGTFQIAVGNDEQGATVIEEGMLPGVPLFRPVQRTPDRGRINA